MKDTWCCLQHHGCNWEGLELKCGNLIHQKVVFCIFRCQSIWVGISGDNQIPEDFGEITNFKIQWRKLMLPAAFKTLGLVIQREIMLSFQNMMLSARLQLKIVCWYAWQSVIVHSSLSRCVFVSGQGHVFQLKEMPLTPHTQLLRLVMTVCGLYLCVLYLCFLACFFYIAFSTFLCRSACQGPILTMQWDGTVE